MNSSKRNILSLALFLYLSLPHSTISAAVLRSLDTNCEMAPQDTVQFGIIGSESYGAVTATKNGSYSSGLNCSVTLTATKGYLLHLAFSEINTRSCNLDYLNVRLGNNSVKKMCGLRHCPSEDCRDLQFDAQTITLSFISSVNGTVASSYTGYKGMITVYSQANSEGNCHTTEQYRCKNRHCIWKGLYCNGHNHCGDESDEPPGCVPFSKQAVWGILVIVFGAASFCVFLPLFCYFAMRSQQRLTINHSSYQPLPTSINDRETTHFTAALNYPANYYGTGLLSSNSSDVGVHSKSSASNYNQDYKTYH